jgi:hypothetical protein
MVLDAKAGIFNGAEARRVAADPVAPDEESGPGACAFEFIDQRG